MWTGDAKPNRAVFPAGAMLARSLFFHPGRTGSEPGWPFANLADNPARFGRCSHQKQKRAAVCAEAPTLTGQFSQTRKLSTLVQWGQTAVLCLSSPVNGQAEIAAEGYVPTAVILHHAQRVLVPVSRSSKYWDKAWTSPEELLPVAIRLTLDAQLVPSEVQDDGSAIRLVATERWKRTWFSTQRVDDPNALLFRGFHITLVTTE
ncbi:hypothetical protein EDB80DRAFT_683939 [Ilyonectria destructans]|nr:hypothetical protein EDB80DRAFT_683939 [Ilyonectria destructans]